MTIYFRVHAVQRMFERRVSAKHVLQTLRSGETIEDYSSEMPKPGRLLLGAAVKRPIHVVASEDPDVGETTVVTVYVPDPKKWNRDFRSRR